MMMIIMVITMIMMKMVDIMISWWRWQYRRLQESEPDPGDHFPTRWLGLGCCGLPLDIWGERSDENDFYLSFWSSSQQSWNPNQCTVL